MCIYVQVGEGGSYLSVLAAPLLENHSVSALDRQDHMSTCLRVLFEWSLNRGVCYNCY